jgi:hypothetical protein
VESVLAVKPAALQSAGPDWMVDCALGGVDAGAGADWAGDAPELFDGLDAVAVGATVPLADWGCAVPAPQPLSRSAAAAAAVVSTSTFLVR